MPEPIGIVVSVVRVPDEVMACSKQFRRARHPNYREAAWAQAAAWIGEFHEHKDHEVRVREFGGDGDETDA